MVDPLGSRRRRRPRAGALALKRLGSPLRARPLREALLGPGRPYAALEVHAEVDSTNEQARRLAARGAGDGTVVIADRQTAGRGRLGRSWSSPAGLGLYVSVLWLPGAAADRVTRWTLCAAVAACEACRAACGRAVAVEWPNDLVYEDSKLAGTLTELRSVGGQPRELVLGTGINVHQRPEDFPRSLHRRATSLQRIAGEGMLEREALARDYLERLAAVVARLRAGAWPELARRWEELAPSARGRRALLHVRSGEAIAGVTEGVADDGALQLRTAHGELVSARMADSVELLGD